MFFCGQTLFYTVFITFFQTEKMHHLRAVLQNVPEFMPNASCYWYRDRGQKQSLAPVACCLPYLTEHYYKTMSCISSLEKVNEYKKGFLCEMMVISIDVCIVTYMSQLWIFDWLEHKRYVRAHSCSQVNRLFSTSGVSLKSSINQP